MKVGIIQSSFLPWRGYFDFINAVDLFVYYDDVQFSKGSWRNRNKFKTRSGTSWVTVPIHKHSLNTRICDTTINYSTDWVKKIKQVFDENYREAEYYEEGAKILDSCLDKRHRTISELNHYSTQRLCDYLGIQTPTVISTKYHLTGKKTNRLLELLCEVGASTYLSGPSAKSYLDEEQFNQAGINLVYKDYTYPEYPQLWGEFATDASIIDLIANCGPGSRNYIIR